MKNWICDKCKKETDKLFIVWGMCGLEKVDVLDYMCPHCNNEKLTFQGTKEQQDAYWDMEWEFNT